MTDKTREAYPDKIEEAYHAFLGELRAADREERDEYRRQEALKGGFCPECTKKGVRRTSLIVFPTQTFECVECRAVHIVTRADRRKSGRSLWD